MTKQPNASIGQVARGKYKVLVIDTKTDKAVYESDWQSNLILNQGMEELVNRTWTACFTYGIAGTGTRANSVDSSTDTAAQSGTTVTKTGAILDFTGTDADVGDMIKWDSGQEARITSITGINSCEVTPSQTVPDGPFTIYHTAQVGLQIETKRSNTYLAGSGNCESSLSGNTLISRRTYDFSIESGPVSYTEVGVGWSSSGSTTVFSRILLGSPVALDNLQKLRLVYQLEITVNPATPVYKTLPVGGWPVAPSTDTNGYEAIQLIGLSSVASNGQTSNWQLFCSSVLEPSTTLGGPNTGCSLAISPVSTALAALDSAVSRATNASYNSSITMTQAAYVPLSFYVDRTGTFDVAEGVRNDLRSVMMGYRNTSGGYYPYTASSQCFTFLFDQNQTKTNTQTLSFTIRISWGRVLA